MIVRVWHGYTKRGNANAYQELLESKILPGIHRVKGYSGCYLLRRDFGTEVEFITLTMWASLEAVREFAGPEGDHAVVPEEARRLLEYFDEKSIHYEATWCP